MTDPQYLADTDLENLVGAAIVDQLFDDDGDGERDEIPLDFCMLRAEHDAAARLLRGWSADAIVTLCQNDVGLRSHVAWMALEYGSERKPQFLNADGTGRWETQYKRAIEHIEALVKARLQSLGEAEAGQNAQETETGAFPDPETGEARFIFAPSRLSPRGPGMF